MIDQLNTLLQLDLFFFIKILVLVLLFGYAIFTFIMLNQVRVMNRIVNTSTSPLVALIAILHFIASVSLFLLALAIL